jgi:dolichol-phosphate mannosyltransferase
MQKPIKTIDVVTSARNEQGNITSLFQGIETSLAGENVSFRLIVTDNRSADGTWDEILSLSKAHPDKVLGLKMSRDFGFEGAIRAGLSRAKADAIVVMASDLQDDPARIPQLIFELNNGVDHVFQVVEDRPDESWLRRKQASAFYALAEKLSDGLIVRNSSTFRAFKLPVLIAIQSLPEKARFLRALSMYVGFNTKGLSFPRASRTKGASKASAFHVIGLGVRGIIANSTKPLDFIGVLGVGLSIFSLLSTIVLALVWVTFGVPFAGFGTLVGLILLAFSSLFFTMGIIAQYLSLMYEEIKARPDYIISESTDVLPS